MITSLIHITVLYKSQPKTTAPPAWYWKNIKHVAEGKKKNHQLAEIWDFNNYQRAPFNNLNMNSYNSIHLYWKSHVK